MKRLMVVGLVLAAGCAVPEPIRPGEQYRIEAQGAWQDFEFAELQSACDDWRQLSGGMLDCVVVREGEPADGHFVRGWSGGVGGMRTKLEPLDATARFDVDGMYAMGMTLRGGLGAMARNTIGLAARIQEHDADGIMCNKGVTPDWTRADLDACVDAGFCVPTATLPARREVVGRKAPAKVKE